MVVGTRDEARETFLRVWDKVQRHAPLQPLEALIAEVIDVDAQSRDPRAVPGAPAPRQVSAAAFTSSLPPTQREIEGVGGEMWYEARHFGTGRAA